MNIQNRQVLSLPEAVAASLRSEQQQQSGGWSVRILAIAVVLCVPGVFIAPVAAQDSTPEYVLSAADDWPIHVTYFRSDKGKESPVVVLLTAANGTEKTSLTRRIWTEQAQHLQRNGFAVLTVDLRKHGDSVPEQVQNPRLNRVQPVDYRNMVTGDMEAVKAFLLEKHEEEELNIRKLGIVAGGDSGLVGAAFALNDWNKPPYPDAPRLADRTPRGQDVRAIVMFSPGLTRGFNATRILRPLSDPTWGIAFRIYHSSEDEEEARRAKRLFRLIDLKGAEYEGLRSIEEAPVSGEAFFEGKMGKLVQEDLTTFLTTHLKELPTPWRSRRSPLDE